MSVAPHSGIVDFGTFTSPNAPLNGIQGEVPAPLLIEDGYFLSTSGWLPVAVGVGTVTSVAATAGTGIAVTGSPITTSGTLNIINTAPDQTVAIASGTGISVAGTYPNFTVTNTAPSSGGTVTSVTGTSPVVSSGGNTPAISIPKATTLIDGYLSATDWTTFNSKQPAGSYLTTVTSDAPLSGSGTSGNHLVIATANTSTTGALTSTDWNTFNGKGSGTVTSVSATAPITSSGGATPNLAMPAATTAVSGYLTNIDWTNFNNKQSAGTYVNSVSGTTGRITSTGGTTPAIDLASGVATVGTTGSSTLIPVVTIDTYGRVTGITTASNPQGTVTSVSGTAPVVSSGGTTPAISMAAATGSVNGYLTSTDWTTFNNKSNTNGTVTSVAALTLGTAGTDLSSTVATGTTTPVISLQVPTASALNRGALSSTDWSTFNGKQATLVSGTSIKTVNSTSLLGAGDVPVGVLTVTGTAPVVSSGGANPAISMPAATTLVNGYLTSTDWTTFNNKGSGTVTSVTGTAPIVSSGGATPAISLATSYGDTQNPYASKTANFVLAAPNGASGVPTFRAVVAADIPTLNQNTSGNASNVTGTVAVLNGGTGQTTYTDGQLLIGNTTGNTLTKTTLTAGGGISVTNASGAITIANTGGTLSSGAGATITTALTSTGLTASLGIGTFEFRAIIFGQSSSAAGGTFQTAFTGTTTSIDTMFQGQATGTTFVATNRVIAQATASTVVWTTQNTEMTMMISGVLVTSTAGTFTINATKTTSGTMTIRSGSNLIIG